MHEQFIAKIVKAEESKRAQNGDSMIDLHGLSVEQARAAVNKHLRLAEQMKIQDIRVVTGRGNHINKKGERGTLFREFPTWLPDDLLTKYNPVKKGDGYYELSAKEK